MKGRTSDELDILFANGVPTRKFKGQDVNSFDRVAVDEAQERAEAKMKTKAARTSV
jgi:hypothetical protein